MSIQYDGAFPVGVSVGAVLLVGDERHVVTIAIFQRGTTRPVFATRSLAVFEKQLAALDGGQNMHIDLSLDRDGTDKVWRYETKRKEYMLMHQAYSDVAWPQAFPAGELDNKHTNADWIDDRNAAKAGIVPGFVVYSGKLDYENDPMWHYVRKSSLWLTNGHLAIRHTSRQGEILDVTECEHSSLYLSGPLHRLQRQHFQPQVEPA